MKCKKCGSFNTMQTKEGKLYCRNCGQVSIIKKQGNFLSKMRFKIFKR